MNLARQALRWLWPTLFVAILLSEIGAGAVVVIHQARFREACHARGGDAYYFGRVWDMTCIMR